jgi:multidrug efflux pump subunit AcrA (membrane-fusion protein)
LNAEMGKKKRKKRLIRLLTLALVAGLGTGAFYLFALPALSAGATTTYDSYTALRGTISNSLSFNGNVSVRDNRTYTASSAATVRQILVGVGQKVEAGDRLMRLSSGETVKADFSGEVNQILVDQGDEVATGTQLIQIVDFDNMEVSMRVDEYKISQLSVGQACRVTVTALEQTFDSTISHINRVSSSGGSTAYYTVTASLNIVQDVLPGMQVTVTIPQEEAVDAVILNRDALSFTMNNSAFVLVQNEAGEMEQKQVEIGVDNDNYVEILSGLEEGDVVYARTEESTSGSGGLSGLMGLLGGGGPAGMPSGMEGPSGMQRGGFEGGSGRGGQGGFSGDRNRN